MEVQYVGTEGPALPTSSMMNLRIDLRLPGLLLAVWCCFENQAAAQLFGARQLRNPLIRQNAIGSGTADAGTLQGNERFLRGNRSAADFVGTANRDEVGFVGQVNALNLDPSQIPTLLGLRERVNRSPQINRPVRKRRPNSLLEPQLELDFGADPAQLQQQTVAATTRLNQSLAAHISPQIEVSVAGRTAILRGEVDSEEAARLAEAMTRLEPGISEVQNELRVREPQH